MIASSIALSVISNSLVASTAPSKPQPVLEFMSNGSVRLPKEVQQGYASLRFCPGVTTVPVPVGTGFQFDGHRSSIELDDVRPLQFTRSMSIATWLRLNDYVVHGPGAQIIFRGDDRIGLDPYQLVILPNRNISFCIQDDQQQSAAVMSPVPLSRWIHILASLDGKTGEMILWLNGKKVDQRITKVRPLRRLEPNHLPGIGIGNVQTRRGPHNQPLSGTIAQLALYDVAVHPRDLDLDFEAWRSEG
jgi:hypothetical protein